MIYRIYNNTCVLLEDGFSGELAKFEKLTTNSMFRGNRPSGIILQDTYNNPFFPIDKPRIDNSTVNIGKIFTQFQLNYAKFKLKNLPWHFVIEIVDGRYICYNTRPINQIFPIDNKIGKKLINEYNNTFYDTHDVLFRNLVEIQQCIHICIIGDTKIDIYTPDLYKLIGQNCILPFKKIMRKNIIFGRTLFCFNIGDKFKSNVLESYIR